jgi:hypothetical protein
MEATLRPFELIVWICTKKIDGIKCTHSDLLKYATHGPILLLLSQNWLDSVITNERSLARSISLPDGIMDLVLQILMSL